MLRTLDIALHENSLESGQWYSMKRSLLETMEKLETVSSGKRLLRHTVSDEK